MWDGGGTVDPPESSSRTKTGSRSDASTDSDALSDAEADADSARLPASG